MQLTFLITDDNYINRNAIKHTLKNYFMPMEEAWNGELAIKQLNKLVNEGPVIHLLDLNMPIMNGYKVMEIMRDNSTRYKNVQTIVVSSVPYAEFILSGLDEVISYYITKPVDRKELIEKIALLQPLINYR